AAEGAAAFAVDNTDVLAGVGERVPRGRDFAARLREVSGGAACEGGEGNEDSEGDEALNSCGHRGLPSGCVGRLGVGSGASVRGRMLYRRAGANFPGFCSRINPCVRMGAIRMRMAPTRGQAA